MSLIYQEFTLNEAAIDTVSATVQDYLNQLNLESRSVHRIRLTVEELLLNVLEHYGSGLKINVGLGKQSERPMLRLRYTADPFNPSQGGTNPLADDMMRSLGLSPVWNCRGKVNTVSLVLAERPQRSTVFYLLVAVCASVIFGVAGNLLSENVRMAVADSILSPLSDTFLGLLKTFAGMMVFLTICNGILGMGDSAAIGRTGKSVASRFIGNSFALSAAAVVSILPFVSLTFSSGGEKQFQSFQSISQMLFDMFPTNLVEPFMTGNTFHIIVIAAFTGCSLLVIGERGSHLRVLIEEAAALFQPKSWIIGAINIKLSYDICWERLKTGPF